MVYIAAYNYDATGVGRGYMYYVSSFYFDVNRWWYDDKMCLYLYFYCSLPRSPSLFAVIVITMQICLHCAVCNCRKACPITHNVNELHLSSGVIWLMVNGDGEVFSFCHMWLCDHVSLFLTARQKFTIVLNLSQNKTNFLLQMYGLRAVLVC